MMAYELLSAARLTGIVQGLQDPRLLPIPPLVWNSRIPDVQAADEDILARFQGQVLIADLIADDAKAAVYSMGRFSFETQKVPNIKIGVSLNQSMLNSLRRIQAGLAGREDMGIFTNWENRAMATVRGGVELRKEVLKVGMLLDGFSYDKLGIKMANVTWGMPSDLKVTPATAWNNTSATPITDIQTVRRIARIRYGMELNRATMSTSALQYMAATTEFINQARVFGWGLMSLPGPAIPLQSDQSIARLGERILGGGEGGTFRIEVDDRRFWGQDSTGAITSSAIQPINQVLLTDSGNDGNGNAYDFAQGVVTESIVANLAQTGVIGRMPIGFGPIGYSAVTESNLNSPGLNYWCVDRGFPRKHLLQSSAVLTVGTFADTITVGVPFPT